MPRVLRIINRLNLGGPTYNAAYLSRYLSPDFETVLAAGMKDDTEESSEYIVEQLGLKPVYIPSMKRDLSFGDDWKSYWFIRDLIKKFRPDIVHTHAAKAGTLGRLAAFHAGVPVVLHTFHGHVFHSYFSPAKTKVFLNIERYLAKRSSSIIAISNIQKKELCDIYKVADHKKVHVINLGFDLDRFMNNREENRNSFRNFYQVPDNILAIGIIGRLVPVKNHPMFLKVIRRLKETTHVPFRVFIIGDGEERSHLEQICSEEGLTFRAGNKEPADVTITFTSWIKNVEWALAGLDLVALSSHNEGTPVSLIEAQASARPVVSTETGGIADVVKPGETALLSRPGDEEGFYKNMLQLVEDATLRKRFSEKGPEFVRDQFHFQRLVKNTEEHYRMLLGKQGLK